MVVTRTSWLRALLAGLLLPGGGFVYLGRPMVGLLCVGACGALTRFSSWGEIAVQVGSALAAGGVALWNHRHGVASRPLPPPAVVAGLAAGLPIVFSLAGAGGFAGLVWGYGQVANRLLLRGLAFYTLWMWWVVLHPRPIAVFVVGLGLAGFEAFRLAWKEVRSDVA
jgi:hypothetical protein